MVASCIDDPACSGFLGALPAAAIEVASEPAADLRLPLACSPQVEGEGRLDPGGVGSSSGQVVSSTVELAVDVSAVISCLGSGVCPFCKHIVKSVQRQGGGLPQGGRSRIPCSIRAIDANVVVADELHVKAV